LPRAGSKRLVGALFGVVVGGVAMENALNHVE
jgi:hypothetical protein